MSRRPVDQNVLLLSFIDMLCCGLGAAVTLLLVFAAMPRKPEGTPVRHVIVGTSTISGEQKRGTKPPSKERHHDTAALRYVTLHGKKLGSIAWPGAPKECESFVERGLLHATFVLACPEGLDPEVNVRAEITGSSGECLEASLIDGAAAPEALRTRAVGATSVVFNAMAKSPISLRPSEQGEACSTTM